MSNTMQVETFEAVEETTDTGQVEFDSEAMELIEKLNLEGQRELLVQRQTGDGDTATVRNPYRMMTAEERRVFAAVCPETTRLEQYNSSSIPLRVLQVAAHAVEFFDYIEVWHPAERVDDDPFLVGIIKEGAKTQWGGKADAPYILARWGRELLPFDEMRELAVEAIRKMWTAKAKSAIRSAEAFMAEMDTHLESHLAGKWVNVPS